MNIGSNRQLSGEYGGQYYTSASGAWNGDWFRIVAVSAAVVTLTTSNVAPASQSITLAQGQEVRGRFSLLQVTSGTVVAYNSKSSGFSWYSTGTKAGFPSTDYLDASFFGSIGTIVQTPAQWTSNLGKQSSARVFNSPDAYSTGLVARQSLNWAGNLLPNEYLLYSYSNDTIEVQFSELISSVGCQLQSSALGTYYFEMQCFGIDGQIILNPTTSGTSNRNADGSAAFLGIACSNKVIKKVRWGLIPPTAKDGKFVINRILFS